VPFLTKPRALLLTLACVLNAACNCSHPPAGTGDAGGSSDGGGADAGPLTLYFEPAAQTVTLDGLGSQSASYVLKVKDAAGNATLVLADSADFDRPDLATVTLAEPVVATAPSTNVLYGGTGTIHAIYGGMSATATLTVVVQLVDYGAGVDAGDQAVGALEGSGLGADPAPGISPLLYPYDQTVWPLGLTSPLVMWTAPQTQDVYRLHYSEQNYSFDGYYILGALPAQMRLDQSLWDRITASNNSVNAPDPLTFTVSRWDHLSQIAYLTATQTWTIAPASLRGAIYYWTASQTAQGVRVGHITRFQPGTGAQPQVLNNGKCMGCHAVNAQGTTLVADIDDQSQGATDPSVGPYGSWSYTRPWATFDISLAGTDAGIPLVNETNKYGADLAITPDGKYAVFGSPTPVASGGGSVGSPAIPGSKFISLGDTTTGTVVANSGLDQVQVDPNMGMMMPAFSPDGTKLAVIEGQFYADNVIPNAADPSQNVNEFIAYLDFDAGAVTFGPTLHKVVDGSDPVFADGGRGLAYPSFNPDSTAVAFHAGTNSTGCTGNCDDTTVDDGNLFIANLIGGAAVRLDAANNSPNPIDWSSSVEPTFNPQQRGGYTWVVFTSMRQWGNVPWPSDVTSSAHVNGKRRLWAAAVDPAIGTADPSHPAFYLEGQENSPNMRGFWTLASCVPSVGGENTAPDAGTACTDGFQCCSGFCVNDQCVDVGAVACLGVGATCSTDAQCCNAPTVSCVNAVCSILIQ
jgi:hypothetical protein